MACTCGRPGFRSTASPASPTIRTTYRAHGKDERILVKSFDEGLVFAYEMAKTIGTPGTKAR